MRGGDAGRREGHPVTAVRVPIHARLDAGVAQRRAREVAADVRRRRLGRHRAVERARPASCSGRGDSGGRRASRRSRRREDRARSPDPPPARAASPDAAAAPAVTPMASASATYARRPIARILREPARTRSDLIAHARARATSSLTSAAVRAQVRSVAAPPGCWEGYGVSILFLLLRLLTAPTPAVARGGRRRRTPRVADARRGAPRRTLASTRSRRDRRRSGEDPGAHARRAGHAVPRELRRAAPGRGTGSRHAGARRDAAPRPTRAAVSAGDRAHARQAPHADRASARDEVERAARLCLDDELSTISATKYEIEVPPAVERHGDGTTRRCRPSIPARTPAALVVPRALRRRARASTCACWRARGRSWRSRCRDRSSARPRRPSRPPCSGPAGNARRPAARAP